MKRLVIALMVLGLAGCGTYPSESEYTIPLEHFGSALESQAAEQADYTLQPEDVLDVLYHFESSSQDIYLVQPQDRLQINFITASEYDAIHQVRPDGYISMPFVGDVKVAGLSVAEVQYKITKTYEPVLKDPVFFVSLAEFQVQQNKLQQALEHPNMGQARLVVVREDYKVSLPMVGELAVNGKSLAQLKSEANRLYGKFSKGLWVDIMLQKSHPRYVYVYGEVMRPGGQPISKDVSLFQAVALAGGPTREAELDTVIVMTEHNGQMQAKVYDFEDLLNGASDGKVTKLSSDDVIYIPRNRLSSTAQVMRNISDIMLFRGIGVTVSYSQSNNDTQVVTPLGPQVNAP